MTPENGFWAVELYGNGYWALTPLRTPLPLAGPPRRVGVFLDYESGDIFFYNMTDGSHIFSFPQTSFSGTLFPYFMIRSGDVSLTVCSKMGGSEGLPVALSNPSLEEPVNLPGAGFSSGSGADGPPGAESPLLPCNPEAVSP